MPLPSPPTQRPDNAHTRRADSKADKEWLIKGAMCALIGLVVLLSPEFIRSPGLREVVAQGALVGWFSLVLGCAFVAMVALRRFRGGPRH